MDEDREFLARRRAEEEAAAVCASSDEERTLRRELAEYYAMRLAQYVDPKRNIADGRNVAGHSEGS